MPHNTGGESSGGTGSPPELDQNQGTEQVLRLPMLSSRRLGRRSAEVSRASHLECWAVVGGAENQLAAAKDTVRLQTRGILYAPDYVVNVGGALFVLGVEIEVVESLRPALWQVSGLTAIGRSEK